MLSRRQASRVSETTGLNSRLPATTYKSWSPFRTSLAACPAAWSEESNDLPSDVPRYSSGSGEENTR